jgi:hypothetical protein
LFEREGRGLGVPTGWGRRPRARPLALSPVECQPMGSKRPRASAGCAVDRTEAASPAPITVQKRWPPVSRGLSLRRSWCRTSIQNLLRDANVRPPDAAPDRLRSLGIRLARPTLACEESGSGLSRGPRPSPPSAPAVPLADRPEPEPTSWRSGNHSLRGDRWGLIRDAMARPPSLLGTGGVVAAETTCSGRLLLQPPARSDQSAQCLVVVRLRRFRRLVVIASAQGLI